MGEGRTTDPASLRKGLGFFEQAVALDPSFVEAWAELSHAATSLYANGVPTPELSQRAKEAAEKAIVLAPKRPDGYAALGGYERLVRNDLDAAAEQYEKGRRLAPGESRFLFATAQVEQGLGRWDASLAAPARRGARQSPLRPDVARPRHDTLRMRRYPEAREALDRALALSPTNIDALEYKAMTYVAEGDLPGREGGREGRAEGGRPDASSLRRSRATTASAGCSTTRSATFCSGSRRAPSTTTGVTGPVSRRRLRTAGRRAERPALRGGGGEGD